MLFSEFALIEFFQNKLDKKIKAVVALDEVGRGCVAGPVFTCATVWTFSSERPPVWVSQIKDSKKLTAKKREKCFDEAVVDLCDKGEIPCGTSANIPFLSLVPSKWSQSFSLDQIDTWLKAQSSFDLQLKCTSFCLGEGSLQEVETLNIWGAIQVAFGRALKEIEKSLKLSQILPEEVLLLMDGNRSIQVPSSFQNSCQATVVQGDGVFLSVGLSSILAKVYRDRLMDQHDQSYPQYGFSKHKGYGTAAHIENILKYGTCPLHRPSFLKKYVSEPVTLF